MEQRIIINTSYTSRIIDYFYQQLYDDKNVEDVKDVEAIKDKVMTLMKAYFDLKSYKLEFIYDYFTYYEENENKNDDDDNDKIDGILTKIFNDYIDPEVFHRSYGSYQNMFYTVACDKDTAKEIFHIVNSNNIGIDTGFISFIYNGEGDLDPDDWVDLGYLLRELEYCYMQHFDENTMFEEVGKVYIFRNIFKNEKNGENEGKCIYCVILDCESG